MKQQDWISVEDNLPVKGIHVLALSSEEKQYIAWVSPNINAWFTEGRNGIESLGVTHWMPLPLPPSSK